MRKCSRCAPQRETSVPAGVCAAGCEGPPRRPRSPTRRVPTKQHRGGKKRAKRPLEPLQCSGGAAEADARAAQRPFLPPLPRSGSYCGSPWPRPVAGAEGGAPSAHSPAVTQRRLPWQPAAGADASSSTDSRRGACSIPGCSSRERGARFTNSRPAAAPVRFLSLAFLFFFPFFFQHSKPPPPPPQAPAPRRTPP